MRCALALPVSSAWRWISARSDAASSASVDALHVHHLRIQSLQEIAGFVEHIGRCRPTCPRRSCGPSARAPRHDRRSCTRSRGHRRPRPPHRRRCCAPRNALPPCRARILRRAVAPYSATLPMIMLSSAANVDSAGGRIDELAAREPLADVIVRVAIEREAHAARNERAKTLARGAAEVQTDRIVWQTGRTVPTRHLAARDRADHSIDVAHLDLRFDLRRRARWRDWQRSSSVVTSRDLSRP